MLSSLYRCCRCHRPMACGSKRIENNSRQIRAMTAPTSQSDRHHRFNHPFHTSIIATNNVNKEHRNNKHINHSNTINPSMIRVVLRPSTTHAASSIEYYRISPIEYRQYHWISSKTQTTITQTHKYTSNRYMPTDVNELGLVLGPKHRYFYTLFWNEEAQRVYNLLPRYLM